MYKSLIVRNSHVLRTELTKPTRKTHRNILRPHFLLSVLMAAAWATVAEAQNTSNGLTIGLNFTGSTYFVDSFQVPPDTVGAVGSSQIVELLNGRYSVYRKSDGMRVQTSSLDQFWTSAGARPAGNTSDSRVLYDPFSQRWFASTGDFVGPQGDNLLLAVSKSFDPTAGWTGFSIPFSGPVGTFIDFPTLGVNKDGVYLYCNRAVLVVPKSDLLAATPTIANATVLKDIALGTPNGAKAQPVVNLDNTGLPEGVLTAWQPTAGVFQRSNIIGEITAPTLVTSDGFVFITPFGGFGNVGAEQLGSTVTIFAAPLDFYSSVVVRNGTIWGVQGVDNHGRAALRWFAIDANSNLVLQEGLITDNNQDVYMGSIAVNQFNDVVIGFNISSRSQFVSSYAVLGTTVNGVTTFGDPLLLKTGVARYEVTFGGPSARWGDYSATVVDPADPFTFWTFQEWPSAVNTWSTQITQLQIPCALDTTNQFNVIKSGFRFNNATGRFVQTVTLQQPTLTPIQLPLSLVLDNLSSNATLFNKTGDATCAMPSGSPYINVPSGGTSVVLEFVDPTKTGITYNTRVLIGSGRR
jgi:hypothetical protein